MILYGGDYARAIDLLAAFLCKDLGTLGLSGALAYRGTRRGRAVNRTAADVDLGSAAVVALIAAGADAGAGIGVGFHCAAGDHNEARRIGVVSAAASAADACAFPVTHSLDVPSGYPDVAGVAFVAVAAADASRKIPAQCCNRTAVNDKIGLAVRTAADASGEIRALSHDGAAVDDDLPWRSDVCSVAFVAADACALAARRSRVKAARALGADRQSRFLIDIDAGGFRGDDSIAANERHVHAPFVNGESRQHVRNGDVVQRNVDVARRFNDNGIGVRAAGYLPGTAFADHKRTCGDIEAGGLRRKAKKNGKNKANAFHAAS